MNKPTEYLFVYADGAWYLKIDTVEQLTNYYEMTSANRYEKAIEMYRSGIRPDTVSELPLQERIKYMGDVNFKYIQAACMLAARNHGNIFDGFRLLNIESGMSALESLREHGSIYINTAGGRTFDLEYTQFCRRKELVFPCYNRSDIMDSNI